MSERGPTEARNPKARGLESFTTRQIVELMNDEDTLVPPAVRAALPAVEKAVDARSAVSPPAMMPWNMSDSTPNVGGASLASSTPRRPLVPAPT